MKWKRDKKTVQISITAACILLVLAGGLLAWTVGRCCQYTFLNRSLTAENRELSNLLADRNQTIDEKMKEIESMQAQLADMLRSEPEELETEKSADIEKHHIFKGLCEGEVQVELYERRDCDELERDLPSLSRCSVHAEIGEWGLDVEQTVKALRGHWEQDDRQDGYYVSLTFRPEMFEEDQKPADVERELQDMQEALCALAGTEYAEMIRETMEQEEAGRFDSFLSFPEDVYLLQVDRQRVVDSGAIGESTQYVLIYEIINGEYVCTQKLILQEQMDGTYELSYYEMGELVEEHIFSDWEEMLTQREALYPDMYYWEY